ncbi:patatin-like phospholipase family protein [Caldicellulosiruptor naganoensis]|uniref:Patatin-like phospholipase family protein n=1 Tax=Caldicellulosiruptor naganoensis TaxID=29324 RepID=A0ABY7BE88_9FIRM|nr:patatin-like phospholipase family protein [Caldicellulosiruptor naganoensis]WAM30733.1 patatin-like phospholipase family protein [Caldicellulosiruptor naganoensis]
MKKVSVALGSGAMRGFAHIGVLEVLEKEFEFEAFSGCSMGAVIGAFYCLGYDLKLIYKIAREMRNDILIDFKIRKNALISGKNIEEILKLFLRDKKFSQLKYPFYVVATDLLRGEQVVFKEGSLYEAIRASISIPGILPPVKLNNTILVDGAVVDKVPAKVLKENGHEFIIGVDVSGKSTTKEPKNIFEMILTTIDIMGEEIFRLKQNYIDYLIKIELEDVNPYTLADIEIAYQRGKEKTKEAVPEIKRLIS